MVFNKVKIIYTGGLHMAIKDEILEEILKEYKNPEDLIGKDGILKDLTKRLIEKAMESELTHHLGYEKYSSAAKKNGNSRNGKSSKTIKGDFGEIPIEVPRDRNGDFNPQIIPKHQTRFSGFDDKIISMYARGMTTRDIQDHLQEIYGVEISADLVSTVTDAVINDVKDWQNRPLDEVYPVLYLDATILKVRHEGRVINKSAYLAIGINMEGKKDVLGIWLEQSEGAKFWLKVMTELKNRGVRDIFIACVDGLKGFPDAIGRDGDWIVAAVEAISSHADCPLHRNSNLDDERQVIAGRTKIGEYGLDAVLTQSPDRPRCIGDLDLGWDLDLSSPGQRQFRQGDSGKRCGSAKRQYPQKHDKNRAYLDH